VGFVAALFLGSGGCELVAVELEQVVGGRQQPPFGADGRSAAAQEAVSAAVGLDLPEHRLDGRLAAPIELAVALAG
jgi:hypothetical protein